MYGHILAIVREYVCEHFGAQAWRDITTKAKCPGTFDRTSQYNESMCNKVLDKALEVTGYKREKFLGQLGEFYLEFVRRIGHDELLRNLGENMLCFLVNLDYLHTYVMNEYPDINMPSFKCETSSKSDEITLHYYSFREGLYPMVMGLLKAIAKTYFSSNLKIEVVSITSEEVSGKKGRREHVVFALSVVKIQFRNFDEPPPTLVAHTRKAGEQQILKRDVDHVAERIEQILRDEGEEALPLNRAKAARAKWMAVARISMLTKGFFPSYPRQLSVGVKVFCESFPFHFVVSPSMEVIHSGAKLQQLMPNIRTRGCRLELFFDLLHPHSTAFTYENMTRFINTPFVLRARKTKLAKEWSQLNPLILRGQMVADDVSDMVIYLCSPFVRSLHDLEERHMFLSDIPIHDVTRDMLWMELMSRYKTGHSGHGRSAVPSQGDSGYSGGGGKPYPVYVTDGSEKQRAPPPVVYVVDGDAQDNSEDLEGLRRQVKSLKDELDAERRRNQQLYYAFLPRTVADQIRSGQKPKAGEFSNVSVLFCDVVAFTEILSRCKAHDIVTLLTELHRRFDRICYAHDTYRVEAIADAYLVVSGVPEAVKNHADKAANTGLGFIIAAREVKSPFNYGDKTSHVKIRIGIHTGSVVCGVVGHDIPRYLVMGDTVNLASKMESHGLADRVQISETTHELLKRKAYRIEKRGNIEIRGRGKTMTYILLASETLTPAELLGREGYRGDDRRAEVTFINEGQEEFPPTTGSTGSGSGTPLIARNRVAPSNAGHYDDQNGRQFGPGPTPQLFSRRSARD